MRPKTQFPPHVQQRCANKTLIASAHTQRVPVSCLILCFISAPTVMDRSWCVCASTEKTTGEWKSSKRFNWRRFVSLYFLHRNKAAAASNITPAKQPLSTTHHMLQIVNDDNLLLLHFRHNAWRIRPRYSMCIWLGTKRSPFSAAAFTCSTDHFACVFSQIEIRLSQCVILKIIKRKRADHSFNVPHQSTCTAVLNGDSTAVTLQCFSLAGIARERYDMFGDVRPVERGKKCSSEGDL